MKNSRRPLVISIVMAILVGALPITVLAGSFGLGGVTVTIPNSYVSCNPSDLIVFDNPGNVAFTYAFFRYDATTNWMHLLGSGSASSSISVPFPYPSIAGTMTFVVNIVVGGRQAAGKWTVTCEPPPGGEGCTPGFWRNHYEDWPPTGYAPTNIFDTVFGTSYFNPAYTLGDAIWQGGGGINRLARHGTAALLSAAHPAVNYPYTVAQVIAMVQSGTIDPLAQANELGCRIR